jgi:hypothetical protein
MDDIRLLFVLDPVRSAYFLVGGDKSGNWDAWYKRNIPVAERRYVEALGGRLSVEATFGNTRYLIAG